MKFESVIYGKLSKHFGIFDRLAENSVDVEIAPKITVSEVILCGFNRVGYSIFNTLKKMKKKLRVS